MLVPLTFYASVYSIFQTMLSMTEDGDDYFAMQFAAALGTYIASGVVSTTDTGVAAGGSYTGAGTGSMAVNVPSLESALKTTFNTMYDDDNLLADNMAADIHSACSASNTVSTTSTGIAISGNTSTPTSGTVHGYFTGSKDIVASALKTVFHSMTDMTTGGDALLASKLTECITAYLTAGTITTGLTSTPFISGSGGGKLT